MASHIVTKLLLASAASLLVQAASAADLAVAPVYNKAPVIAPLASWSGFYIGGNVGYGWGSRSVGLPLTTTDPALAPALAAVVASGARPASLSPSTKGVIGGGQIGYNWQLSSPWLLGLEADLQGSDVKGTATQARLRLALTPPRPASANRSIGSGPFAAASVSWRPRNGFCMQRAVWPMARPNSVSARWILLQGVSPARRFVRADHRPVFVWAGLRELASRRCWPRTGASRSNISMSILAGSPWPLRHRRYRVSFLPRPPTSARISFAPA